MLKSIPGIEYSLDERFLARRVAFHQLLQIFSASKIFIATTEGLTGNHKCDFLRSMFVYKLYGCISHHKTGREHHLGVLASNRALCPSACALDERNAREILLTNVSGRIAKVKTFGWQPADFTH